MATTSRSKSRSRSPSPRRSGSQDKREYAERIRDAVPVGKDDAAFLLGKNGSTKKKLARVSCAELDLDEHDLQLHIYGTEVQCKRAKDYANYVTQQRVGPVYIDLTKETRDDLTVVEVPEDCVGFVMGRGGATLRSMEEEWGTLMFFAQVRAPNDDEAEKLCIFGTLRARRGAELKVMSAVEHKHPGHFVRGESLLECTRAVGDDADEDWGTDTMLLSEEEFSYALGSKGSTRRKLATAAGCILEYVGKLACICGYRKERRRAKDYIKWLIMQRTGVVSVDVLDREDVTVVEVPAGSVGFITGYRGESLRRIEAMSGTFCFTDGGEGELSKSKDFEKLLIFSHDYYNRKKAKRIVKDKIDEHKELNRRGQRGGGYAAEYGGRDRGRGGGYDDRDRYDNRDRGNRNDDRYRHDDRDRYDRDRDDRRSRSRDRRRSRSPRDRRY